MKTFLRQAALVIFCSICLKWIFVDFNGWAFAPKSILQKESVIHKPIDLFFIQDFSGSARHSVSFASSQSFRPLFDCTDRDIRIGFASLTAHSAQPPTFITLAARQFTAPTLANLGLLEITERKKEKERFSKAADQYRRDSISYFADRNVRIKRFCKTVDSIISLYKNNYTPQSDLSTAIAVADVSFNYGSDHTRRIIILNSDGKDSYGRRINPLHNKAEVVLVNADKHKTTSLDTILTKAFSTVDQAILFSLSNL